MKPETFDLLLNSYLKERIPDFDNLLYDASGADHVFQGRKGSMAFAPMPMLRSPPPRIFQEMGDVQDASGADHISPYRKGSMDFAPVLMQCSPPPGIFQKMGDVQDDEEETVSDFSFPSESAQICTDSIDGPRNMEQETCRSVAKQLSEMAEEFEKKHLDLTEGTNSSIIPSEPPEGFTPEEWNTLRRMYSDGSALNVSRIAAILADGFTPRTFQSAITFLSERINDLKLQLAVALELTAQVVQRLGGSALDTARRIIHARFEDQAELENLQTTEESAPE